MRKALVGLALLGLLGAVAGPGCGTEPVAVEGCRRIEEARCDQAPRCPNLKVPDVDACKRFYRDQCLHGLTVTTDPGDPSIDRCVQAITAAGQCTAADNGCVATSRAVASGCEVVEHPEIAVDCAFLNPPSSAAGGPTLVAGAGGQGGAGAGGAGAGGAGAGGAGAGGEATAGGAAGQAGASTTAGAGGAGM